MKTSIALLFALVSASLFLASPARAGAGGTLSGNSNSAITLSSGTETINSGVLLNVTSSGAVAISVTGTSSIVNSGTIEELTAPTGSSQGKGRAIRDNTGNLTLTITNNAGALIKTEDADPIQMNVPGSTVTLYNYGTVTSVNSSNGGAQAIDWNALNTTTGSNTLYNYSTGILQANEADAVRPGVNGVIYNDGKIIATNNPSTLGDGSDGIDLQNNSGVTVINANTNPLNNPITNSSSSPNLIEGARHGITGGQDIDSHDAAYNQNFTLSVTNYSNGTIKGDDGSGINIDGVSSKEVVTVVNSGTITGNGVDGDGDGVDVDGLVNITNTGTIKSLNAYEDTSEGVTVGGGTITNSGLIEGSISTPSTGAVGRGITLAGIDKTVTSGTTTNLSAPQRIYADTTVTNQAGGLIKGDSDSGIAILGTTNGVGVSTVYSVTINNEAGAKIEGAGAVAVIDGSALANGVGTASSNNETVINAGTIQVDGTGKAISLGSGTNTVKIIGGTASINGDISGGTTNGSNSLVIDPNDVTDSSGATGQSFTYSHVLSNFGSVEIKSGTVTFSGDNTYTGTTTIDSTATLDLTGAGTIGNTTTLTIGSGATFDLGGGTVTVGTLANAGSINNGTVLTSGSGSVSNVSGNTGLSQSNSDTTTSVTGTNTYTGNTSVTGGTLDVSGSITHSTTTVSGGGNLHLSGGTTSAVVLNSGGSVTGNGTVGTLQINSGGILSPGNSPGTVNAGNTTFNPGGTFILQMNTDGSTGTPGTNWDQLAITGTLDMSSLSPSLTFNLDLQTLDGSNAANPLAIFNPNANHVWDNFVTTTGGVSGFNSADFAIDTTGFQNSLNGTFSVGLDGNNLDLHYQVAPEPGTWLLLIMGLSGLAFMRKMRRQS